MVKNRRVRVRVLPRLATVSGLGTLTVARTIFARHGEEDKAGRKGGGEDHAEESTGLKVAGCQRGSGEQRKMEETGCEMTLSSTVNQTVTLFTT